jgi:hypothetical protein
VEGEPHGKNKMALYRMGSSGGVPHFLFSLDSITYLWCTNRSVNLCVLGQPVPNKGELVFSSFDLAGTNKKELLRIPLEPGSDGRLDYSWQLSPDGSRIGILRMHQNHIRMFPLRGGKETVVILKGHPDLINLNWAVDSQSMFVSALEPDGATLLHVDNNGNSQPIWHQPQKSWVWALSSPDERHLAIMGASSEANAWSISNF